MPLPSVAGASPGPRAKKRTLIWFGTLVAAVIALGELYILPEAVAGIPAYGSLDMTRGTLTQAAGCAGKRQSLSVVLSSEGLPLQVWLPCAPELVQLHERLGAQLEVRSRRLWPSFLHPVAEIWSVKVDGAQVYSYEARAIRTKRSGRYVLAVSFALFQVALYGLFAWTVLRAPARARK